jgi:4-aminobutyrate aminotransferase
MTMSATSHTQTTTQTQRVLDAKRQHVARGIGTPPIVVASADGAWIEDVDGRRYLDFVGGVGCQNIGHRFPAAVAAMHDQIDRYLQLCAPIAFYEPYVDVCARLNGLSPCTGTEQRSALFNTGAEAVEAAVRIARSATQRPGVIVFDGAFHGRSLLTVTMTGNLFYKRGPIGPLASDVHRVPCPYPYRGVTTADALRALDVLFRTDLDPSTVACIVIEPVLGEGGFIPMPEDFLRALRSICDEHQIVFIADEVQAGVGRTGRVWAIERSGVQPDLITAGKSLGGGLPLSAVTGNAAIIDAIPPGGLGGTFGGNPAACAAALAILDEVTSATFQDRAEAIAVALRSGLEAMAERIPQIGEVRGLGSMIAIELVADRETRTPVDAQLVFRAIDEAYDRGLLILECGLQNNGIRLLVPLVISDADLAHGLGLLEQSLAAAFA